jgi:hypothetical protein
VFRLFGRLVCRFSKLEETRPLRTGKTGNEYEDDDEGRDERNEAWTSYGAIEGTEGAIEGTDSKGIERKEPRKTDFSGNPTS